jgi:glycerol uptake facilitator protein
MITSYLKYKKKSKLCLRRDWRILCSEYRAYAINPACDFGPRLWIALVSGGASQTSYIWIPIVAPLLGGVVGAFIYDYTIGRVIEAKGLGKSGDTETVGESVCEPEM